MTDLLGLAILIITLFIPLIFSRNKKLLPITAIYIGLLLRHTVAFYNSYIGATPGAEVDAANMFEFASFYGNDCNAEWEYTPGWIYAYSLGQLFCLTGISKFFASELSVLAYTVSLVFIIKITEILDFNIEQQKRTFSFISLMPSLILFGSVTLRESYQMLFFICPVYIGLLLRKKPGLIKLLIAIVSAILLGTLHNGLSIYCVLLIAIVIFWGFKLDNNNGGGLGMKLIGLILSGALIAVFSALGSKLGGGAEILANGDLADTAISYRQGGDESARANYTVGVNPSSPLQFLLFSPYLLFMYMFAPLPWQVSSIIDIVSLIENGIRFILIRYSIIQWRKSKGEDRAIQTYLLVAFLSIEFIWSTGTVNWGTAFRHHIPAHGILCVLGSYNFFKDKNKSKFSANSY